MKKSRRRSDATIIILRFMEKEAGSANSVDREQGHRWDIVIIGMGMGNNIEKIVAVVHADWPHTAVYTG